MSVWRDKNFSCADSWGPEYVVKVYNPEIGLKGILIIDNTALGMGKGGIRMARNATEKEAFC